MLEAIETSGQRTRTWFTSLDPWNQLVEPIRADWGDCQLAINLAVTASGIRAADEKGSLGEGLFDSNHPICERARYARLRAGTPKWWNSQLAEATSDSERAFLSALFFTWASPRTIEQEILAFDEFLRGAAPRERRLVSNAVHRASNMLGPDARATRRGDIRDLPDELSPLTAITLSARYDEEREPDPFYERYVAGKAVTDPQVAHYAVRAALAVAAADSSRWPDALETIRSAYVVGASVGRHLWQQVKGLEIPASLAAEVVEQWAEYPLEVVGFAERSCRREVGKYVEPLEAIAQRQGWEWV